MCVAVFCSINKTRAGENNSRALWRTARATQENRPERREEKNRRVN